MHVTCEPGEGKKTAIEINLPWLMYDRSVVSGCLQKLSEDVRNTHRSVAMQNPRCIHRYLARAQMQVS